MIATLEGILSERAPDVVVETAGVGYAVLMPAGDVERLPAEGATVRLWTHLAVREDAWTLYGFLERETRTLFRLLTTVSGIGPKVALGMLSGASARDIAAALVRGDEKALTALPGVGKKSAARLVVELGAKVPPELSFADADAPTAATPGSDPVRTEAEAVLSSMGLPPARIVRVLDEARAEDAALADDAMAWVRAALKRIG